MKPFKILPILLFIALFIGIPNISTTGSQDLRLEEAEDLDYPDGCTVIIVGKDASADGSVMSTHTCDCGHCDWTFRYVPAADHEPGAVRKIYHIDQYTTWPPEKGLKWERIKDAYTGKDIPQVAHTYAFIHGMFGYMNENQVAIGESTVSTHEEMKNETPSALLDLSTLTLIAMERVTTARDAIQIMGSLAETYGYGFHDDGEMLAVSDPNEVWIFEIMPVGPLWTPKRGTPGAIWCAQRVSDNHVSVCPNESRIGEIDLDNKDYFMASPNVMSFAVKHGYYDPESGEAFNWKKAYSPRPGSAASTGGVWGRMWRFFDLVAPSQKFNPETPNMDLPFSVKPDKKLSVQDVMNFTRDKYQGSIFDTGAGLRGGPFHNPNYHPRPVEVDGKKYSTPRTISVNRAEYTTVTQCRDWLPNPIGGIVWLAFGAQDTSCFMPLYIGIKEIPYSFQIGDHWTFNRESARWAFDYVDFHTLVVYMYAIQDVKNAQKKWEADLVGRTPVIDEFARKLYQKDPAQAADFLTNYCLTNANSVVKAWWELGDELLVKYRGLWLYNKETRKKELMIYPEDWLIEMIKYHNLPLEEKKKEKQ